MKSIKSRWLAFIAFMAIIVFASCSAGTLPSDDVGLAAAFGHCAGTTSYWVWGLILTAVVGGGLYACYRQYQKEGTYSSWVLFGLLAILFLAWFVRPCDLAYNTTVEQAARGVWIGY